MIGNVRRQPFSSYWEETYLHLQGRPDRFAHYFSLRDMDTWLTSVRSGLPDSVMITAPEGAEARTEKYRPQEVRLDVAYASLARGSSLVLNHMEDWPSMLGLVKALGRDFHADIGVNAYLTPKGARTFPIHTDGHDVLILHLEGEKVWHLHDFSLLQLGLSQKKNFNFSQEWYGRTETPQIAEIRLKPGDLLFIPRGMPHYATAQGSACLHLTVSITPLYWMDFLKIAAENAAIYSQEIRRALPPGFVTDPKICERMRDTFQEVMKAFQEVTSFDEVLAAVKRDRVASRDILDHLVFLAGGHVKAEAHMGAAEAGSHEEEGVAPAAVHKGSDERMDEAPRHQIEALMMVEMS